MTHYYHTYFKPSHCIMCLVLTLKWHCGVKLPILGRVLDHNNIMVASVREVRLNL